MTYTKKAIATRKRIIDSAAELFLSKGYHRTRLDEILLASQVQKGNFYYYFSSKEELALTVVRELGRPQVVSWVSSLADPAGDALDNLRRMGGAIATAPGTLEGPASALAVIVLELAGIGVELRRESAVLMEELGTRLAEELKRLQPHGQLAPPSHAATAGAFMLSVALGAMLEFRASGDTTHATDTIEHAIIVATSSTRPPTSAEK